MIERLDLELLVTFVTIVDCGGFTRAANRLGRTQSSVSMQLKRLEDRFGRRLVHRSARGVRPTEEGQVLLDYARRIVDLSAEAELRMVTLSLQGQVRVGLPEWFASDWLQSTLARFSRAHPHVHLVVRVGPSDEMRQAANAGDLDVALTIRQSDEAAPSMHSEPLYWVAGRFNQPDLKGELPLALFNAPCLYRQIAIDALSSAERSWRVTFTSTGASSLRGAVQAGLGISVFPKSVFEESPDGLQRLSGLPALPRTELGIYEGPHVTSGPAAHLGAYLREAMNTAGTGPHMPSAPEAVA